MCLKSDPTKFLIFNECSAVRKANSSCEMCCLIYICDLTCTYRLNCWCITQNRKCVFPACRLVIKDPQSVTQHMLHFCFNLQALIVSLLWTGANVVVTCACTSSCTVIRDLTVFFYSSTRGGCLVCFIQNK